MHAHGILGPRRIVRANDGGTAEQLLRALLLPIALSCTPALAQAPPVQTCQLGDLGLESGEVIRNFRMTYIAFGALNAEKSALATKEIRDLLDRIADGKPGISGPRFPHNWTRPDFCPG